jgi:probable HAF family extracellular repeat protein
MKHLSIWTAALVLGALLAGAVPAPGAPPFYTVTWLGDLGGGFARPFGVNDAGQVVGSSPNAQGRDHAFLWQNGAMQDLGTLGGERSIARAVNSSGQVVGFAQDEQGRTRAFIWEGGTMRPLGTGEDANGINDLGQVVGETGGRPCLWDGGAVEYLQVPAGYWGESARAINNFGQIVGWAEAPDGHTHGVLWQSGHMYDIGGLLGYGVESTANAVNGSGQVVGSAGEGSDMRAVLWQNLTVQDLGTPGQSTWADDVNDSQQVVGRGDSGGWLWEAGVMYNLNDYLVGGAASGRVSKAYGINSRGQIVGTGSDPAGRGGALLLTPVPEPSSLTALLCGLGGMAGIVRYRRR